MGSLRARLFLSLAAVIIATGVGAGGLAYQWAFDEAIELQDSILIQIGAVAVNTRFQSNAPTKSAVDAEAQVVIEELGNEGADLQDQQVLRMLPDGLHIVTRGHQVWRVLIRTRPDNSRMAIGQLTAIRDEIARDSALHTVLPLAALIPCLMLVVGIVIRRSFRPISLLATQLDAQQFDHLERLPLEGTPIELRPFIDSINRLLERIQTMIDQQRRFVADAAHELRSPITALGLQAENLHQAELTPESRGRLVALKDGVRRTAHLLDQLLTLARYDIRSAASLPVTPLDYVAREVVSALLSDAINRGIDLGFERVAPILVRGEPVTLAIMIRNLINNALRHTPKGGRVDISLYQEDSRAILQIEDTGPGIPSADIDRIFEPFFRGSRPTSDGTGLGLSIVSRILDRLSGSIILENIKASDRSGLRVIVCFPLAR